MITNQTFTAELSFDKTLDDKYFYQCTFEKLCFTRITKTKFFACTFVSCGFENVDIVKSVFEDNLFKDCDFDSATMVEVRSKNNDFLDCYLSFLKVYGGDVRDIFTARLNPNCFPLVAHKNTVWIGCKEATIDEWLGEYGENLLHYYHNQQDYEPYYRGILETLKNLYPTKELQ